MIDEIPPTPVAPPSAPVSTELSAPTQKSPGFFSRIKSFLSANPTRTKFLGIIIIAVTLPLIVVTALTVQNLKQKASVSDLIKISDETGNLITSTANPNIFVDIDLSTSTQWKLPEQPSAYNGLVKKAYASACMESCLDNGNLSYGQCQSNCGETPTATPVPLPTATTAPLPTATSVPATPTSIPPTDTPPASIPVTSSGTTTASTCPAMNAIIIQGLDCSQNVNGINYGIRNKVSTGTNTDGTCGETIKSELCGSGERCVQDAGQNARCVKYTAPPTQAPQNSSWIPFFGGGASSQSTPPTPTPTPNILKIVLIENKDGGTGGSQPMRIIVNSKADIAHISWKLNDWVSEETQTANQNPSTEKESAPTPTEEIIPTRNLTRPTLTPIPQTNNPNQANPNQQALGVSDTASVTETTAPIQATQTQARTVQITFMAADQSVAPVIFPITIMLTKPTIPVSPAVSANPTAESPSPTPIDVAALKAKMDINKDGVVDRKDIMKLQQDISSKKTTPEENLDNSDNKNVVDAVDLNALLRYLAPTPTPAPVTATSTSVACWVTTSPSAINLSVRETAKISASVTSGLGTATITKMFFQSYDGAVVTTNPEFSTTLPYSTTVTAKAQGAKQVVAKAYLSDGRICVTTSKTDTDVIVTALPSTTTLTPTQTSVNQ